MDIIDILLASGFKSGAIKAATERANAAASEAASAAADANTAISAIYHDKNFILTVNEDNSLSLTYDPDAV